MCWSIFYFIKLLQNLLNTYLVYTTSSRALATLEVSVLLDLSEDLPIDRYYLEIDIPDDILILALFSWPGNYNKWIQDVILKILPPKSSQT